MLLEADRVLLNQYRNQPKHLLDAITGLTSEQLDLCRAPGKWTIRQLLHHIVDCELNYFQKHRVAFSNTGHKFIFDDGFDPDIWADSMKYSERPIYVELKLFELVREYIVYLYETLSVPLDRVVTIGNEQVIIRDEVIWDLSHANHHIDQILETRSVHSL
ncbi:DinB family protein [Paenibacillus rhizovicinus]|uniref:DinB family protein n=1 Tax=Paenibacillus rhizovicinus TaxID=2704463 RepID=A0A6C0P5A6_9BACL|nr:DinB family protein [Paenibacillus rhizovicinus]QHW33689.1 DinB family protein [Paenibacillus rhizovicinus]